MKNLTIDYKRIFSDILETKFPEKKEEYLPFLESNTLSAIDVLKINTQIFGTSKESQSFNQRHRSYRKSDILKILDYQKKNNLNNSQLASHFHLSRNTVAKWKKMFLT